MGISIWQLLIILLIVLVVFGAKRLRGLGGDLGSAIKGFRDSMKEDEDSRFADQPQRLEQTSSDRVIDTESGRAGMTSKSNVRDKDTV